MFLCGVPECRYEFTSGSEHIEHLVNNHGYISPNLNLTSTSARMRVPHTRIKVEYEDYLPEIKIEPQSCENCNCNCKVPELRTESKTSDSSFPVSKEGLKRTVTKREEDLAEDVFSDSYLSTGNQLSVEYKKCVENEKSRNKPKRLKGCPGETKLYRCCECSYSSSLKTNLLRHQRTHTGVKPFKCSECPYAASQKIHLVIHLYKHTGLQPFKCSECPYAAPTKFCLVRHQRKHAVEKPYKCSECLYATSNRTNLVRHQRIHTGDKSFKCSKCPYKATLKQHLVLHQKRLHSE